MVMAAPATLHLIRISFFWLCRALALLILTAAVHGAPKWDPVNKDELAESKPIVEPDAGAEIIWRKVIMDHSAIAWRNDKHYIRAKIYSQKGVDDFAKIDIEYGTASQVADVAARTIKPDGTIVDLNPKEIYEREIIKFGSERWKVKSFALPALEPGVVVEYQYTIKDNDPDYFTRIDFQSEHPTRQVRFKLNIEPPVSWWTIRAKLFNCKEQPIEKGTDGFFTFEMKNVPADKKEDFSPPELNNSIAMLIYPSGYTGDDPKEFWRDQSLALQHDFETTTWQAKAIRATLAGIVSASDPAAKKLELIHDYCRSKIINYSFDPTAAKKRKNKDPDDKISAAATLKAGAGDPEDVNALFAALARAAGFEVKFIGCSDRSILFFSAEYCEPWVIPHRAIAVLVEGQWQYFDPGARFLPARMLSWRNADTTALIGDSKRTGELRQIPGAPAETNTRTRKATLQLAEDGTLEGEVEETYSGQWDAECKQSMFSDTPAKREEQVRQSIQQYQSMAELSAINVENIEDPITPLRVTYHLRIPNYADLTGSRLFFQPAVFQKGKPPLFENATRRTDILFHYRLIEKDEVHIAIPDGFKFEQPSAPGPLDLGELGRYENQLSIVDKARVLVCVRTYRRTCVAISKTFYPALVTAFQGINKRDNHTITLKRRDPPVPIQSTPVTPPQPTVTSATTPAAESADKQQ